MRRFVPIPVVILLTLAPAAFADSIQFTLNSSVHVSGISEDDSYWGIYQTQEDAYGTMSSVIVGLPYATGTTTVPNVSFFLPSGVVVTSATMTVLFPETIVGTGTVAIAPEPIPPPDLNPDSLHIPPTFNTPAVANFFEGSVFDTDSLNGYQTSYLTGDISLTPIIDGNEISIGTLDLSFLEGGELVGTVATPGYNWAGYIGGSAQADVPYSVQIDVEYTPVPEPSGFVLVGTTMLGFVGVARRKFMTS
jgi:hypothetical protein